MIGQIKGIIIAKQAPDLLVDVQGIGYEVLVSLGTFFDIPEIGGAVTLHTQFFVCEAVQRLFGLATLAERALFRQLIKVDGVGPKMTLAILSGMFAGVFVLAVHN